MALEKTVSKATKHFTHELYSVFVLQVQLLVTTTNKSPLLSNLPEFTILKY